MLNLAPACSFAFVATMVLISSVEAAAAQSALTPPVDQQDFTIRQIVLPTQFRIQAESSDAYRFQVMMTDDRSWSGVMERGGQVWTATERGCPSFKGALEAFGQLPPLFPGPYDLRANPQPREVRPRAVHGRSWTLKLGGFAPDHSHVDLEISGNQGPYPQWASQMVEAIEACGPPIP